jgi:hypothetical protein
VSLNDVDNLSAEILVRKSVGQIYLSKAAEGTFVLEFSSFHRFDENLNGYFFLQPVWAVRSVPGLSVVSFNCSTFSGQT